MGVASKTSFTIALYIKEDNHVGGVEVRVNP